MEKTSLYIILFAILIIIGSGIFLVCKKEKYYPYYDELNNTSWNNASPNWRFDLPKELKNNKCRDHGL